MEDFKHMCSQPSCYDTENDTTMYRVQSRHGDGAFTVCGSHLIEREVDRAEAVVTAETTDAAAANAEVLANLKD
jgi:hypothetical protein